MSAQNFSATRIAGGCGAEIDGVDLSRPLEAETVAAIRAAILEHQVIFFRDQQAMDDAALERFTQYFGAFGIEPRPEFTCRFTWSPGALAMWDNRCVQHLALNDYDGFRRELHRTTVRGARPRGFDSGPLRRAAE